MGTRQVQRVRHKRIRRRYRRPPARASAFGRAYPPEGGDPGDGRLSQEERWAYGLALFGIGLGVAELALPGRLSRMVGIPAGHRTLIRAMGVREIASGIGILKGDAPAAGVWSRVAGDALDLACLGTAFFSGRALKGRLSAAAAGVAGAALLDLLCARQLSRGMRTVGGVIPATATIAVNRSPADLYRYWRNLSNLPQFMKHLESVHVTDDHRSHWTARGPAGTVVEWDAEITEDRPDELIAWRSIAGSKLDHSGSVRFIPAPGKRGAFVSIDMRYRPPGGTLGDALASLFGKDPVLTIKTDLRRFKQTMETGEIITTEGQPAGRHSGTSWK